MSKITINELGKLQVPSNPTIPVIEGDGVGGEITPAMQQIVNAAVQKAYHGEKVIQWVPFIPKIKTKDIY